MRHWTISIIDWVARACCAAAGIALLLSAPPNAVGAQAETGAWGEPTNISRSGAASGPVLVADPEGNPQLFWWDRLSGMMTSAWDGREWSDPRSSQVFMQAGPSQPAPRPLGSMPDLTYDARGWAHAWWQQAGDADTASSQLWHSRLIIGADGWFRPEMIAESALAFDVAHDTEGGLHVVYVRNLHTSSESAGVYYRYSPDSGSSWSDPAMLYDSIYFRLLSAENAYAQVISDGKGQTLAIWDSPRLRKSLIARTTEGGWEPPQELELRWTPREIQLALFPGESIALLSPGVQGSACSLQYILSSDGGRTWSPRQPAPESVDRCVGRVELMLSNNTLVAASGIGSDALTLSPWDQQRWLDGSPLPFGFTHPELGAEVSLAELQILLVGDAAIVAGTGSAGDVWSLVGHGPIQDLARAVPPIWSAPLSISAAHDPIGAISMDSDEQGQLHALWVSESAESGVALYHSSWDGTSDLLPDGLSSISPAVAAQSPGGRAAQPMIVVAGDQLFAYWEDGRYGEILYNQAYVPGPRQQPEWRQPLALPSPSLVGASPAIDVDPYGSLHVAYVAPINEQRGAYYIRSDDAGQTWSQPDLIFDASQAGWVTLGQPSISVDERGTRHVAWARTSLGSDLAPLGVYYARLPAGEEDWSKPVRMAQEGSGAPAIISTMTGQTHLIWQEVAQSNRCWHQWSTDGGQSWTAPRPLSGMERISGNLAVESDGSGALHLVALATTQSSQPVLRHMIWNGERWRASDAQALGGFGQTTFSVALALQPQEGRLHIGFVGSQDPDGEGSGLWVSSRSLPPVEVIPFPTLTPQPTPTVAAAPTATPTLSPDLPTAPELASGGLTDLPAPLILGAILAAILVAAVILAKSILARR